MKENKAMVAAIILFAILFLVPPTLVFIGQQHRLVKNQVKILDEKYGSVEEKVRNELREEFKDSVRVLELKNAEYLYLSLWPKVRKKEKSKGLNQTKEIKFGSPKFDSVFSSLNTDGSRLDV